MATTKRMQKKSSSPASGQPVKHRVQIKLNGAPTDGSRTAVASPKHIEAGINDTIAFREQNNRTIKVQFVNGSPFQSSTVDTSDPQKCVHERVGEPFRYECSVLVGGIFVSYPFSDDGGDVHVGHGA
jgi:hypothetical protein